MASRKEMPLTTAGALAVGVCCLYCRMPCCAVPCCAVLCRAVSCCVMLCCAVLCCVELCCVVLCCFYRRVCCAVLCRAMLCCVMLCRAVLCCLHGDALRHAVRLCKSVLRYAMLRHERHKAPRRPRRSVKESLPQLALFECRQDASLHPATLLHCSILCLSLDLCQTHARLSCDPFHKSGRRI